MTTYATTPEHDCPTCGSHSPERHPAMQLEGEVELCTDAYHLIPTAQNRQAYIDAVLEKRAMLSEREKNHG